MRGRWQTLAGVEAKSRIYLVLIGRPEGLNVSRLKPIFEISGKLFKGYTRPYVETTVKQMVRDGTVKTRLVTREGMRPVIAYRADIGVYLEFLKDCVGAGKKELKEVKGIVLRFAPVLNRIGEADRRNVDALFDISLCGVAPTYFTSDIPKDDFFEGMCREMEKMLGPSPLSSLKILSHTFKALAASVVERLYSFPKVELDEKAISEAKEHEQLFANALVASGFLAPTVKRKDLGEISRLMKRHKSLFYTPERIGRTKAKKTKRR